MRAAVPKSPTRTRARARRARQGGKGKKGKHRRGEQGYEEEDEDDCYTVGSMIRPYLDTKAWSFDFLNRPFELLMADSLVEPDEDKSPGSSNAVSWSVYETGHGFPGGSMTTSEEELPFLIKEHPRPRPRNFKYRAPGEVTTTIANCVPFAKLIFTVPDEYDQDIGLRPVREESRDNPDCRLTVNTTVKPKQVVEQCHKICRKSRATSISPKRLRWMKESEWGWSREYKLEEKATLRDESVDGSLEMTANVRLQLGVSVIL